jgi:hypothetical protein
MALNEGYGHCFPFDMTDNQEMIWVCQQLLIRIGLELNDSRVLLRAHTRTNTLTCEEKDSTLPKVFSSSLASDDLSDYVLVACESNKSRWLVCINLVWD